MLYFMIYIPVIITKTLKKCFYLNETRVFLTKYYCIWFSQYCL